MEIKITLRILNLLKLNFSSFLPRIDTKNKITNRYKTFSYMQF